MRRAPEIFGLFDLNNDGKITSDELSKNKKEPQREATGQQNRPQPSDGSRQPWILVHADEVDLNKDGVISRAEIVG